MRFNPSSILNLRSSESIRIGKAAIELAGNPLGCWLLWRRRRDSNLREVALKRFSRPFSVPIDNGI